MLQGIIQRVKAAFVARDIYVTAKDLHNRHQALSSYLTYEDPEDAEQAQMYLAEWDAKVLAFFDQHADTLDLMAVWFDLDEAARLLAEIRALHIEGEFLWSMLSE